MLTLIRGVGFARAIRHVGLGFERDGEAVSFGAFADKVDGDYGGRTLDVVFVVGDESIPGSAGVRGELDGREHTRAVRPPRRRVRVVQGGLDAVPEAVGHDS